MSNSLFRAWGPSPKGKDPEIQKLDRQLDETRQTLQALQHKGRQRRAHDLQGREALETRQSTLIEIFKRMEKELDDKHVDAYADVLAEVFGERKIFAHRAIGLEALLCQFMHQMLAKQHQLKIMKRSGKDLFKYFQKITRNYKEEFHSYQALAVHLETMRLSLEAQYDDIFAAQHALLAQINHVEAAGGTMTNYKIVKPTKPDSKTKKKPKLQVSTKHALTAKDMATTPVSVRVDSNDLDNDSALILKDVLSSRDEDGLLPPNSGRSSPKERRSSQRSCDSGSSTHQKSARERRREIEQKQLAKGRGGSTTSSLTMPMDDAESKEKARERLRELEANRAHRATPTNKLRDYGELKEHRRSSHRSPGSRKSSTSTKNDESIGSINDSRYYSPGSNGSAAGNADEEEARRRRQEQRKDRAAVRSSART